ncbi:MAG: transglutaminase-like domain-containing protein [Clostridia bacterium]|nr:transglutaminase-like domain-containing protein [Clostridia bacterium]
MRIDECIQSLSMPLPEDIMKRKWAGDLEGAMAAIDIRLAGDLPQMLRDRLTVEKERIRRLPTQYPWQREEAIAKLRELVPDITDEEFDQLELAGRIDFIYINGVKHYFVRFHRTLVKTIPAMMARTGNMPTPVSKWLDPMIAVIKDKGVMSRRITVEASIGLSEGRFVPGKYRVWLPFPAKSAQQSDIRLVDGNPDVIGDENAFARSAYWEKDLTSEERTAIRYSYVSTIRYANPLHAAAPDAPLYPDALPVEDADLSEELPYIRFTPYLKSLAADLAGDETDPIQKAWRFYCFATQKITYSFVRDYFQIDDIGEYCALNSKGDCGLQALLFIALCRISGIPARWQSGMSIDDDYVGAHDWAQFYVDGWGWLFCDPSYGGSAWRAKNTERHEFYFGNIDPMRMAANRRYQAPLTPAIGCFRVDPYDNQTGEMERVGAEIPFNGRDLDEDACLIGFEELG